MKKNTVLYLFSLLSGILNNKNIGLPEDLDLSELYKLSSSHSLIPAVFIALEPYAEEIKDKELFEKWKKEKNISLYKQVQFDIEREAILDHLTSIGCWHMPLKGSILKDLYINPAMRDMCDNDILFDDNFSEKIKEYMVNRGYEAFVNKGKDDLYKKPPFFVFEMHRAFVENSENKNFKEYYQNVQQRLITDEENPYLRHFSDEDFYIYMVLHEYRHYNLGGTGLRSFIDNYVYISKKGDNLDWEYIKKEFNKLGLTEFEEDMRKLSIKLLEYPQDFVFTKDESDMIKYVLTSGTYGTRKNYIENNLKNSYGENITKMQKTEYLSSRIFINKELMKKRYSWLKKWPFLLPLGYLHRIFICGIPSFKRLSEEIKIVWKK